MYGLGLVFEIIVGYVIFGVKIDGFVVRCTFVFWVIKRLLDRVFGFSF